MRRRRTGRATVAIAAAVVLAVGACGGDDGEDERSQPSITAPSTSTSTATTAPAEPERVEVEAPPDEPRPDIDVNVTYPSDFTDEQVAVVEAYRGYWHAYYVARDPCGPSEPGSPPACATDPTDALLEQHAVGVRLDAVRANLESRRNSVAVLPPGGLYRHHVTDVDIDDLGAVLTACSVDDAVVLDVGSGEILDDDVLTTRVRATLERHSERWVVSGEAIVVLDEWTGDKEAQCLANT